MAQFDMQVLAEQLAEIVAEEVAASVDVRFKQMEKRIAELEEQVTRP